MTDKITTKYGNLYSVPAPLVHNILKSVVGAILILGGYMVVWGINDATFKATVITKLTFIDARITEIGKDQDQHEARKHDAVEHERTN
jgi:hypothetical protein